MLETPDDEFDQALNGQARIEKLNHLFEADPSLFTRDS
jgi:hypothetical protein